MFFMGASLVLLCVLVFVALVILLPELKNSLDTLPTGRVFAMPDIKINFSTLDSDQIKSLELFKNTETEFTYVAEDGLGKQVTDKISAPTKEDAQKILEELGLKVLSMGEANIGRRQPFTPY